MNEHRQDLPDRRCPAPLRPPMRAGSVLRLMLGTVTAQIPSGSATVQVGGWLSGWLSKRGTGEQDCGAGEEGSKTGFH